MNTLFVCIYADTTPFYDKCSLMYMEFPEEIVRDYYEAFCAEDCGDMTFEKWFEEEYTADDTDGLYYYAESKGFAGTTYDILW